MSEYMRGLSEEKFQKVFKELIDKVEINEKDWQDIIEEFDLGLHRDKWLIKFKRGNLI